MNSRPRFFRPCNSLAEASLLAATMNKTCIVDCKIMKRFVKMFKTPFGLCVSKAAAMPPKTAKANTLVNETNKRCSSTENLQETGVNFMFFILSAANIMAPVINKNMDVSEAWTRIMAVLDIGWCVTNT